MKRPKKLISGIINLGFGGMFLGILTLIFGGIDLAYLITYRNEILDNPLWLTFTILVIVLAFACGALILMNKNRVWGCLGIGVSALFLVLSTIISIALSLG